MDGKVNGSPTVGSFTLSAFEVRKVKLSKHKLELEADRYGLHFFGALPYEDDTKSFDKVKISKKPIHITIERELIVVPKVKKDKSKKDAARSSAAQGSKTSDGAAAPGCAKTCHRNRRAQGAVSPAHSAMVMNKALDNIFASDIDQSMMSHLPDYWQEYFTSKSQHRQFMPADSNIKVVSEGMTPPKVLNSIDPSSNEYAQKYGIAGIELLRTVVDANGRSAADGDCPPYWLRARRKGSGSDQEFALPTGNLERSAGTGGDRFGRHLPHLLQLDQTGFGDQGIEADCAGRFCSRHGDIQVIGFQC